MRFTSRTGRAATWILVVSGLALGGSACVATVSGRVYDPVYADYHYWNNDEEGYFQVYLSENNLPHREFRSMNRDDRNKYWKWRHNRYPDHH